jgi:hypothetical protein
MAAAKPIVRMYLSLAYECWRLARREAEVYQRHMHEATSPEAYLQCKAARDAVDRIAQVIRFGRISIRPYPRRKGPGPGKKRKP